MVGGGRRIAEPEVAKVVFGRRLASAALPRGSVCVMVNIGIPGWLTSTSSDRKASTPMDPIVVPIDGVLDLHTFVPTELDELINDYIDACLSENIVDLRIIHGKGRGVMRTRVRALLAGDPRVEAVADAPADAGGWGATLVRLKTR